MVFEAFPAGMPRGAPWEGVPGHECTVRSKCDWIRPRVLCTCSGLAKGCRTTTQTAPHAPGCDAKSQRATLSRASKRGSTGCRRLECWTSSRTGTWDVRESGLIQGCVAPVLAGPKWGRIPDTTASRERESACNTCPEARIDRRHKHNTPLQRHGPYGVHSCVAHFTEPFF